MHNFFESDEFSLLNLTEAINNLQVVPNRVAGMGLFRGGGITTTTVALEIRDQTLHLIPAQPRGTMPEYNPGTPRKLVPLPIPHLPKNDTVIADAYQNIRAFGSESALESVATVVNQKLAELRSEHDLTHEYYRVSALQGKILDADATTELINMFTIMGVVRVTVNWDTSNNTGLKEACISIRRQIESALKLRPYSGIHCFCSEGLWDQLLTQDETRDAYNRYQENSFARDSNMSPFPYSQVTFEEMRGKIGSSNYLIPADTGACFPLGAPIYRQNFAPATFIETVNTVGRPYYAKQERLKFDTGVELHTQSNPIFYVTHPLALVELTYS